MLLVVLNRPCRLFLLYTIYLPVVAGDVSFWVHGTIRFITVGRNLSGLTIEETHIDSTKAFNAALVIFGSLIVASKERDRNPSAWTMIYHSRSYIDTAAETLRQLDSGNPVVERCQAYLSQLSLILDPLS